jgi:hypothetical protein
MADINARIQIRRDTEANWTSVNPVLLEGEIGFVTDKNYFKIGDGITAFDSLQMQYLTPYVDTQANLTSDNPVLLAGQIGFVSDKDYFKLGDGVTAFNSITKSYYSNSSQYQTIEDLDISATSYTRGLSSLYSQPEGYTEAYTWVGGDGSNNLKLDGDDLTGKTIDGVDAEQWVTDFAGEGQGIVGFRVLSSTALVTVDFEDSDGGQFAGERWEKHYDGLQVVSHRKTEANVDIDTSSGTGGFFKDLPVQTWPIQFVDGNIDLLITDYRGVFAQLRELPDLTATQYKPRARSIEEALTQDVRWFALARGRWTTLHPRRIA